MSPARLRDQRHLGTRLVIGGSTRLLSLPPKGFRTSGCSRSILASSLGGSLGPLRLAPHPLSPPLSLIGIVLGLLSSLLRSARALLCLPIRLPHPPRHRRGGVARQGPEVPGRGQLPSQAAGPEFLRGSLVQGGSEKGLPDLVERGSTRRVPTLGHQGLRPGEQPVHHTPATGGHLPKGLGTSTGERLAMRASKLLPHREELLKLASMVAAKLVDGPCGHVRLARPLEARGSLTIAGLEQLRGKPVPLGGELVERKLVEAVEPFVDLGHASAGYLPALRGTRNPRRTRDGPQIASA